MSGYNWGPGGPPPEAYSRVTNPERFAPLHQFALDSLDRLEASFDVERCEAYGLAPELENQSGIELARPTVRLLPRNIDAAPILVVFTAFPGIIVRLGRWYTEPFPNCGCDACDETAESETESFESEIDDVTSGRFREEIEIADRALVRSWFWSPRGRSSRGSWLDVNRAREMLAESGQSVSEWKPWT